LRVRPGILSATPNGAAPVWTLRVQAADAWDAVRVECTPDTTVRAMKQAAMADLLPDIEHHEQYLVKLRGAEIFNESLTLQQAGALNASTLFLTSRRRRPVR
jgi:hypothetical protein